MRPFCGSWRSLVGEFAVTLVASESAQIRLQMALRLCALRFLKKFLKARGWQLTRNFKTRVPRVMDKKQRTRPVQSPGLSVKACVFLRARGLIR